MIILKTDKMRQLREKENNTTITYEVEGPKEDQEKSLPESFASIKEIITACDDVKDLESIQRFEASLRESPNLQFARGYYEEELDKLDMQEKVCLLGMASQFYKTHGESCIEGINEDQQCVGQTDTPKGEELMNKLVGKGLVTISIIRDDTDEQTKETMLAPSLLRALFRGCSELINYRKLSMYATIFPCAKIPKKELFYEGEALEQIETIKAIIDPTKYEQIASILKEKGFGNGIIGLLHGAPGTGKTELVKQLALQTGRDVMAAEPAHIIAASWGASEKNARALFKSYKTLYALSDKVPILLFNESDSLLNKRIDVERSIDKSENTMQAIFLEELESFEGILFATTNLAPQLDPAYERRFLFKVEVQVPSAKTRAKIWKTNLPELSDEDARELADTYEFAGGSINNIARKCIIHYAIHDRTLPAIDEIKRFCNAEQIDKKKSTSSSIRGFESFKL